MELIQSNSLKRKPKIANKYEKQNNRLAYETDKKSKRKTTLLNA